MKATVQDVADYITEYFGSEFFVLEGDTLIVYLLVSFEHMDDKFTELPEGLIFNCECSFNKSNFKVLPQNMSIGCLTITGTDITVVPGTYKLYYLEATTVKNLVLEDGLFINHIFWNDHNYSHLNKSEIDGYIMGGSILS